MGGRGLPRGRPRPTRFAGSLPPFPAARSPDFPAPFGLTGMGRGAWELGPRGSETSSSPPGWEQRQARAHRLSSVPRRQGLLDDRRSAALSARERSPRGARREGIPPPALSCPGRSASQLPKLKCSRRASPAVGAFGLGAVRGRSVDRRQTPFPVSRGRSSGLCPSEKSVLRAACTEFLVVRSRRPLHCLLCNLLLLILAVGENSFSE